MKNQGVSQKGLEIGEAKGVRGGEGESQGSLSEGDQDSEPEQAVFKD